MSLPHFIARKCAVARPRAFPWEHFVGTARCGIFWSRFLLCCADDPLLRRDAAMIPRWCPPMLSALLALVCVSAAFADDRAGWAGSVDGVWNWRLPDTPNGLKPIQSWHSTGSSPDGDIYVGGMDHATNSALYRLDARACMLRYLGDARAASETAGNWRPGETAQKFHTRPLWFDGKVYVATLDSSTLDDVYLRRRGFHWYAYDPAQDRFADLSATEPGGVGAARMGLVTLAADPARNLIYGAAIPTAEIFRYDVARGRT